MKLIFKVYIFCFGLYEAYSSGTNICAKAQCNSRRNEATFDCTDPMQTSIELTSDILVPDTIRTITFKDCAMVFINSQCLSSHNLNLTDLHLVNVETFEIRFNYSLKGIEMRTDGRDTTTIIKPGGFINSTCEIKFSTEEDFDIQKEVPDICITGCEIEEMKKNCLQLPNQDHGTVRFQDSHIGLIQTGALNFTSLKLISFKRNHITEIQRYGITALNSDQLQLEQNNFTRIGFHGIRVTSNDIDIKENRFASLGNGELTAVQPLPRSKPGVSKLSFTKNVVENLNGTLFLFNSQVNLSYSGTTIKNNTFPCSCGAADYFNKGIETIGLETPNGKFLTELKKTIRCTSNAKQTLAEIPAVNCRDARQLPQHSIAPRLIIGNLALFVLCTASLV